MDNPTVFRHEGGSLIVTGGRFSRNSPHAPLYTRGEKAGSLVWHDNKLLEFTSDETSGLRKALETPVPFTEGGAARLAN